MPEARRGEARPRRERRGALREQGQQDTDRRPSSSRRWGHLCGCGASALRRVAVQVCVAVDNSGALPLQWLRRAACEQVCRPLKPALSAFLAALQ